MCVVVYALLKFFVNAIHQRFDPRFITAVIGPLPNPDGANQPSTLQHGKILRHRGLRQTCLFLYLPYADTVLKASLSLFREVDLRRFKPR